MIIFNSSSDPKFLSTNIPLGKNIDFSSQAAKREHSFKHFSNQSLSAMAVVETLRQVTMVTCSLPMVGGNWGCMGSTGGVPESPLSSWSTTIPQHESKPLQRGENTTRDVHRRGYNCAL